MDSSGPTAIMVHTGCSAPRKPGVEVEELESQAAVNHLIRELGPKLKSSARAIPALNH